MNTSPSAWQGLESLEPRTLLAAVFWDGGGGDLSWHNPLNWSGDVLPGPADDVTIAIAGANPVITHDQSVRTSIRSLSTTESLRLSAGTLEVAASWDQRAPLFVEGGDIAGAATLRLSDLMTFTGGTISGGPLLVTARGALRIQPDPAAESTPALLRRVVNYGTVSSFGGGEWRLGSELVNRGTLELIGGGFIDTAAGVSTAQQPAWITNFGTVNRYGTGELTLRGAGGGVHFGNKAGATVRIQDGRLNLYGGVAGGGNWTFPGGGELAIGGLAGSLSHAWFTGDVRMRLGTTLRWESGLIATAGAQSYLIVGPTGLFEIHGGNLIAGDPLGHNSFGFSTVTNYGTIALADGQADFLGTVNSAGTISVNPGGMSIGALNLAPTSTIRIRSTGPDTGQTGSLSLLNHSTIAGSLVADFTWNPGAGQDIFFLSHYDWYLSSSYFSSVSATGLFPGLRATFTTMGQRIGFSGYLSIRNLT